MGHSGSPLSLPEPSPARSLAFGVLLRTRDGAFADRAFRAEAERAHVSARDRALAQRLAYGTVQRRRTLDWLIDGALAPGRELEPDVREILRLGSYELAFCDGIPARATVSESVNLARGLAGDGRRRTARAGLVNAVLRRISDEAGDRLRALDDGDAAGAALVHSVPDALAGALFVALGADDARGVLRAANEAAESALRWNPLRGPRASLERLLPEWHRDELLPEAYVVEGQFDLEGSPVWASGLAMAQSRASMLPARVLAPQARERVLDLCAAPGAKATHLAALAGNGAEIVAVEPHRGRADDLRRLARRMGARLQVIEGDGRSVELEGPFDAALVDAPCTGLGVLAARPDARWRPEERADGLPELQQALLERALDAVGATGRVVYSTCTLTVAENEAVVRASGATVCDLTDAFPGLAHPRLPGALLSLPHRHGTDGFFVALLGNTR